MMPAAVAAGDVTVAKPARPAAVSSRLRQPEVEDLHDAVAGESLTLAGLRSRWTMPMFVRGFERSRQSGARWARPRQSESARGSGARARSSPSTNSMHQRRAEYRPPEPVFSKP